MPGGSRGGWTVRSPPGGRVSSPRSAARRPRRVDAHAEFAWRLRAWVRTVLAETWIVRCDDLGDDVSAAGAGSGRACCGRGQPPWLVLTRSPRSPARRTAARRLVTPSLA